MFRYPTSLFFERYSDKDLKELESLPLESDQAETQARNERSAKRYKLLSELIPFLAAEEVVAVIVPTRDGRQRGRHRDHLRRNGPRSAAHRTTEIRLVPFPLVVVQIESYGRVFRLLENHVPVSLEMDVETKFTGDHEHGFDTVAEIPGTDSIRTRWSGWRPPG